MKILHIIPSYLPAKLASGPIIPTQNLNKELVKRGIEMVVYTTNLDDQEILDVPLNQEVNINGVKVFYFPIIFKSWQYSYKLHRALAKNIKDFDLIHITSVFLSVSTLGAYYAKKYKKPYIISPHGSLMDEPLKHHSPKKWLYVSLFEKRNLKNASAIHFLIEQEKEDYLKTGLPLKRAIIIPNSLDIEDYEIRNQYENTKLRKGFREKFGISPDKKVILFLSRLNWIKGLDTLIPAFAGVIKKKPDCVLVLAGPDEKGYKKEIIKMIDEINIETSDVLRTSDVQDINPHKSAEISINQCFNIIFTGMLIGEEKFAAFRESDVFVLPSYSENFGNVVLEAMYFGLPVIITKYVGISPSIKKAGAGLVINKDEKQLAEAILKILDNPDLAKKMGEAGKQLVKTEFSSEKVAEKWIEEYRNLIKNIN